MPPKKDRSYAETVKRSIESRSEEETRIVVETPLESDSELQTSEEMSNSQGNFNNQDNTNLILVSTVLTGLNYIPWKRSMMLALNAKRKSKHILTDDRPVGSVTSDDYLKWKETDDLVFSWIINSLHKDLANVVLFAKTARDLWKELEQRYGESNGPLIFKLRREICGMKQGNQALVDFFNKIKRKWDEYSEVKSPITCSCGEARKKILEAIEEEQLMQLLSGLNPEFDHVCDQILIIDPLPSVNRAFSMLTCIEQQRSGRENSQIEFVNSSTTYAQGSGSHNPGSGYNGSKGNFKNNTGGSTNKDDKFCNYCKKSGHIKQECFRLVGYPDWYKGKKSGSGNGAKFQANMTQSQSRSQSSQSPFDDSDEDCEDDRASMKSMVQKEVQKALKGKITQDGSPKNDLPAFAGVCTAGPGW